MKKLLLTKMPIFNLRGTEKTQFFSKLKSYVYVYCEIDEENKRIPIYIGKGKRDRCLSHLKNLDGENNQKDKRISDLVATNRLGIDIIAYGLNEQNALVVESACIDLMGVDNLENKHRGQGENVKRIPLNELTRILMEKTVAVSRKHRGVAILINRDYKPTFGDLELLEITRGIWKKGMVTIAGDSKYAYTTHKGVVKEVYEIHSWVPAGTQEYFTRELENIKNWEDRWEFVGRKAPDDIRKRYVGNIIERERSHGNSFIPVPS